MLDQFLPFDWEAFHFIRPMWLWLFLPAVLLLGIGIWGVRDEVKWKKIIAPPLRNYVITKGSERTKVGMQVVLFCILALGTLALAGPTWKSEEVPGRKLETPLVICLELSQSMLGTDIQPTRLERAKFKISDLLDQNPRARTALVVFAASAHTVVPLTKDYEIIKNDVEVLSPSIMPQPGASIKAALTLADSIMSVTEAPGTVLLMADDFDEAAFGHISDFVIGSQNNIVLMPFNTPEGSPIPTAVGSGFLKDKNGNEYRSSLNQAVIQQVSALENASVIPLTLDDSDVAKISDQVKSNLIFTEQPEKKDDQWQDAGWLLVVPMALLFLMWFRRGWVVYCVGWLLLSSCGKVESFEDLWYTKAYQGQRLSDQGKYEEAASVFDDPLRKGVAYFKAGDYADAIQAFSQDTSATGAYNLGLAYFKNGDMEQALTAFGLASQLDPAMEDAQANQKALSKMLGEQSEMDPEKAKEADQSNVKNTLQNDSNEDLSGGGQEATKKDMEKQRLSETVSTDIRKGKELDEVPDDVGGKKQQQSQSTKVLMRKVNDDPSLFLQRKFAYQLKKGKVKPDPDAKEW